MQHQIISNLGQHFHAFVDEQLATGRYQSADEVIRAGLRLLEDNEKQLLELRALIEAGDKQIRNGEFADYNYEAMKAELLGGE